MGASPSSSFATRWTSHGSVPAPGHGREPHLPVEAVVVRRDPARPPPRIAGLALELVLLPASPLVRCASPRAFEHDLVALAADAAERAVGVHEVERIEGRVHPLAPARACSATGFRLRSATTSGERVGRRARAALRASAPATRARDASRGARAATSRCSSAVVEAGEGDRDRQPVQERQVAAQDQQRLEERPISAPATWRARRGPKTNHGRDQLDDVVEERPRAWWNQAGSWWKYQESGFGLGCVS